MSKKSFEEVVQEIGTEKVMQLTMIASTFGKQYGLAPGNVLELMSLIPSVVRDEPITMRQLHYQLLIALANKVDEVIAGEEGSDATVDISFAPKLRAAALDQPKTKPTNPANILPPSATLQ